MLSAAGSPMHAQHPNHALPSPHLVGHMPHSTTPTASPLALMGKPGPQPSTSRKSRSSTSEAKTNKVRPSPLLKPSQSGRRKRDASQPSPASAVPPGIPSAPTSRRQSSSDPSGPSSHSRESSLHQQSVSEMVNNLVSSSSASGSSSSASYSFSSFTPLVQASGTAEASPSEDAASTPSPIDLSSSMPPPAPPTSKPLTPGSIMGIRSAPQDGRGAPAASRPGTNLAGGATNESLQQQAMRSHLQAVSGAPAPSATHARSRSNSTKGKGRASGAEMQPAQYAPLAPAGVPTSPTSLIPTQGLPPGPKVTFAQPSPAMKASPNVAMSPGSLKPILPGGERGACA